MEFWKSFADDTYWWSSVNQRNQSAFGATRQFVALAMIIFLASCGSKKQVYYADATMNEQTIIAKGKSKKQLQKKKDEEVVYSSDPTTRYIQQYAAIAQEEMRRYKIPWYHLGTRTARISIGTRRTCSKIKQSFWNQMQAWLEGKEGISWRRCSGRVFSGV